MAVTPAGAEVTNAVATNWKKIWKKNLRPLADKRYYTKAQIDAANKEFKQVFLLSKIAEAHGRAEMMEFNYLFEKGAIRRDTTSTVTWTQPC